MIGDGFLQQMAKTLQYNREILGSRKSARELYRDEVKSRSSSHENIDIHALRLRVAQRLKRNRFYEFINRTLANLLLIAFFCGIYWVFNSRENFSISKASKQQGSGYFSTNLYHQSNGMDLRVDYYHHGTKAAETLFKDGLRHQNSESYYQSGEQFRSALYYMDTLVTELYLFKSGDTIKDFPKIVDDRIYDISLNDTKEKKRIEFKFYDGKVIPDSYKEYHLNR